MIELEDIDSFIASVFLGNRIAWPDAWQGSEPAETVRFRIDYHGIAVAIGERWRELADWPVEVLDWVRQQSREQTFWEESHRKTFSSLISQLDSRGISSLMLKGTALAYSVYDNPAMRRRGDTDILIRKSQLKATRAVLAEVGFRMGESRLTQEDWIFDTGMGFIHHLDLHWEFSSSPALSQIFDVEELFNRAAEQSVGLPRLHPAARAVDPVALLIHCSINQALHSANGFHAGGRLVVGSDRLIWALDSHLLASNFSDRQWAELAAMCEQKSIAPLCLQALQTAQRQLGTHVPAGVLSELSRTPRDTTYIDYVRGADKRSMFAADWKATHGTAAQGRFLLWHTFPSAGRMRELYPESTTVPLAWLYLRRMAAAPRKLLAQVTL